MSAKPAKSGGGDARSSGALRLRSRAEYLKVYDQGRKQFSRNFTCFFWLMPAGSREEKSRSAAAVQVSAGDVKFGITCGKVLGNAVMRNKIKRRTRELLRQAHAGFAASVKARNLGAEVVVHPKRAVAAGDFPALATELRNTLEKIAGEKV